MDHNIGLQPSYCNILSHKSSNTNDIFHSCWPTFGANVTRKVSKLESNKVLLCDVINLPPTSVSDLHPM